MRADFLGVPIDLLSLDETLARVTESMKTRTPLLHVALNVAKFVHMQDNKELRDDVTSADIIGVDGMGIVYAARLFGVAVPERVPGVDLMEAILAVCARDGYRPYFLGATEEVLNQAVTNVRAQYPALTFAGFRNGYFKPADEPGIVAQIRESGADCLFIGMPTPRKERFLAAHRRDLGVSYIMGVGGGIDVLAGHVNRAPQWMQQNGLEWLYRIIQEPGRMWKRYLTTNVGFAMILVKALLGGRRKPA